MIFLTSIFKRLFSFVVMLIIASLVIFYALEVLPGNAAQILAGAEADVETVENLTKELGLDQPAFIRYKEWIAGIFTANLGLSYIYATPVSDLIAERLTITIPLAFMAMLLSISIAIPLGAYAAAHQNKASDHLITTIASLGMAIPSFWLAIILIFIFTVQLQWFNYGGFPGWDPSTGGNPWKALSALFLPALALALFQASVLLRVTRASMLEIKHADFIRTVRGKGMGIRPIFYKHVLLNAWVPILTIAGLQFANLLAGAIVVENVFSLPGLGRLLFQSVANRDLIIIRNALLFLVALIMLINLLIDFICTRIDPRMVKHAQAD